jgi:hypothetical protein
MSSKIIDDLTHIPNIIAGLGLGVAEAQRHFDLNYLEGLERMLVMAQSFLGGGKPSSSDPAAAVDADKQKKIDQFQLVIKEFLMAFAPTRYQFTETTLSVKLDMAQHLDVSAGVGISAGISAVTVNASLSIGYGSDYRGAAEVKTVLQAVPPDPTTLRTMLDRAKELHGKELTLPERSAVDKKVEERAGSIYEKLVGFKGEPVKTA